MTKLISTLMIVQILCIISGVIAFFTAIYYLYERVIAGRKAGVMARVVIVSFIAYVIFYLVWMVMQ